MGIIAKVSEMSVVFLFLVFSFLIPLASHSGGFYEQAFSKEVRCLPDLLNTVISSKYFFSSVSHTLPSAVRTFLLLCFDIP